MDKKELEPWEQTLEELKKIAILFGWSPEEKLNSKKKNKEVGPGEEVSSLLKQIAENVGYDPKTKSLKEGVMIFVIRLNKKLFQKLEDQRGSVARSVYVESLLKKHLVDQDTEKK